MADEALPPADHGLRLTVLDPNGEVAYAYEGVASDVDRLLQLISMQEAITLPDGSTMDPKAAQWHIVDRKYGGPRMEIQVVTVTPL